MTKTLCPIRRARTCPCIWISLQFTGETGMRGALQKPPLSLETKVQALGGSRGPATLWLQQTNKHEKAGMGRWWQLQVERDLRGTASQYMDLRCWFEQTIKNFYEITGEMLTLAKYLLILNHHSFLSGIILLSLCFSKKKKDSRDFSGDPVSKTPCSQCRGPRFTPWSGN